MASPLDWWIRPWVSSGHEHGSVELVTLSIYCSLSPVTERLVVQRLRAGYLAMLIIVRVGMFCLDGRV